MVELCEDLFRSYLNLEESVLFQNKFEKKKEAIWLYMVEVSMVICNMQSEVF